MARTLLVYGDSNSHGTMPLPDLQTRGRYGQADRWPGVMAARLGPGWRVIDEGLPGRTTVHPDPLSGAHKNGLMVLPAVLESHAPLDLVVLMLGTNDLKARFALSAGEVAQGAELLIRAIRLSGCGPESGAPAILLVCPPAVDEAGCLAETYRGAADKSRCLAGHYAETAARLGTGFIDAGAVVVPSPVDGVHFEAADHHRLGMRIAEAVLAMQT